MSKMEKGWMIRDSEGTRSINNSSGTRSEDFDKHIQVSQAVLVDFGVKDLTDLLLFRDNECGC